MFAKVMPWRSMNACIEASSPFHATPTTVILSAHCLLAASTEAASALHALQPGAQNQKATGLPMNEAASIWPPPTVGEVKANRLDGEVATVVGSAVVIFAELPHAVSAAAAAIKATVRIARR